MASQKRDEHALGSLGPNTVIAGPLRSHTAGFPPKQQLTWFQHPHQLRIPSELQLQVLLHEPKLQDVAAAASSPPAPVLTPTPVAKALIPPSMATLWAVAKRSWL